MTAMPRRAIVLVHGAWHGGWCWWKVAPALRAAGHDVYTPTLSGLADRHHLLTRATTLQTHIDDVANLIVWEDLHDVLLVGHSYAGRVVGGVADRMPERIRTLVYLDAMIPAAGRTGFHYMAQERRATMLENAARHGEGWKLPPIPAPFWNIQDPADEARVAKLCTPQPLSTMTAPSTVTGAWEQVPEKVYALAAGYVGSTFHTYYEDVRARPDWRTVEFDCGHEIMLDRPEAFIRLMDALA